MKEIVALFAGLSPRKQPVLFGAVLLALNEALANEYGWETWWKAVGLAGVAWMVKSWTVTTEEAEIGRYVGAVEHQAVAQAAELIERRAAPKRPPVAAKRTEKR